MAGRCCWRWLSSIARAACCRPRKASRHGASRCSSPLIVLTGLVEGGGVFFLTDALHHAGTEPLLRALRRARARARARLARLPSSDCGDRGSARARRARRSPAGCCSSWGQSLPLALVALPVVVALSGQAARPPAGVAGLAAWITGAYFKYRAGHARRFQPGVRAAAPAGARRAAITGAAAAKQGRRHGCDHDSGSRRQRRRSTATGTLTRPRRRCRASASRHCSCRACAPPCATRTTTCRCIARASTPRGITPDDIRTLDDVERLPFTVKTDLRDHYPFGLFARPVQRSRAAARVVGDHRQADGRRLHASGTSTSGPT